MTDASAMSPSRSGSESDATRPARLPPAFVERTGIGCDKIADAPELDFKQDDRLSFKTGSYGQANNTRSNDGRVVR